MTSGKLITCGKSTTHGTCEYCGSYNSNLKIIRITTNDKFLWTDRQHRMFTQPFWCCSGCMFDLHRKKIEFRHHNLMIREEPLDKRLLETGHIRNILTRKMKCLEEILPDEIDGIYILPPGDLPEKFKKKTNILVSFKNLSLLKYFRYVLDRDVCLMHTWSDTASSKFINRCKFWRAKDSRILLALGRIHFQSEFLAIWIWADTRMVSIEFFCKTPANMTQAMPKKVLRVI